MKVVGNDEKIINLKLRLKRKISTSRNDLNYEHVSLFNQIFKSAIICMDPW